MYKIDFNNPCHIYFMGIGGISMSAFAELLHSEGFTISGSDMKESKITNHLESKGIHIFYGQRASNITKNIDLVVYTAAISSFNPEFVAAKEAGIPMMDRAEMVGQVMANYDVPIAISGTHGKTTTTSMLSHIFLSAKKDPTISVGGILKAIDGNLRIGQSENFITEACEYTNSFLKFNPKISIILNIEADHLDFFKDLDDIRNSFYLFAKRLPEDGTLIINGTINDYKSLMSDINCKMISYGFNKALYDYAAGGKLSLFDAYENAKIRFTVPAGFIIEEQPGKVELISSDDDGKVYEISVGDEQNVIRPGKSDSITMNAYIDGNGKRAVGEQFNLSEISVAFYADVKVADKTDTEHVEYPGNIETVTYANQPGETTLTLVSDDVWHIKKSLNSTGDPYTVVRDGERNPEFVDITYLIEVGMYGSSNTISRQPDGVVYQTYGRTGFQEGSFKITDSLKIVTENAPEPASE